MGQLEMALGGNANHVIEKFVIHVMQYSPSCNITGSQFTSV